MNRKPIYDKDSSSIRVISRPNGLWAAQRKVADKGTRERDCWADVQRATTLNEAMRQAGIKNAA